MNKLFIVVILAIISFIGYGVYSQIQSESKKKEKRIPCQKETVTFEKITNIDLIEKSVDLLKTGNYIVKSRIEQSKYMKSKILNYISIKEANLYLKNSIEKYSTNTKYSEEKLLIDYYIWENDKEDKGKKSDKAKLYAGYLVFEFKLKNQLVYKIQTDYMKMDTSDIPNRMNCIIESFITLKRK